MVCCLLSLSFLSVFSVSLSICLSWTYAFWFLPVKEIINTHCSDDNIFNIFISSCLYPCMSCLVCLSVLSLPLLMTLTERDLKWWLKNLLIFSCLANCIYYVYMYVFMFEYIYVSLPLSRSLSSTFHIWMSSWSKFHVKHVSFYVCLCVSMLVCLFPVVCLSRFIPECRPEQNFV